MTLLLLLAFEIVILSDYFYRNLKWHLEDLLADLANIFWLFQSNFLKILNFIIIIITKINLLVLYSFIFIVYLYFIVINAIILKDQIIIFKAIYLYFLDYYFS